MCSCASHYVCYVFPKIFVRQTSICGHLFNQYKIQGEKKNKKQNQNKTKANKQKIKLQVGIFVCKQGEKPMLTLLTVFVNVKP